ncbi:MAG: hypothetical protein GVY12_11915 [Bacteroidetes bacterium]|jgi:hypothetical protein|nr:hypothetical protein [Bacteroidota bacterium]
MPTHRRPLSLNGKPRDFLFLIGWALVLVALSYSSFIELVHTLVFVPLLACYLVGRGVDWTSTALPPKVDFLFIGGLGVVLVALNAVDLMGYVHDFLFLAGLVCYGVGRFVEAWLQAQPATARDEAATPAG